MIEAELPIATPDTVVAVDDDAEYLEFIEREIFRPVQRQIGHQLRLVKARSLKEGIEAFRAETARIFLGISDLQMWNTSSGQHAEFAHFGATENDEGLAVIRAARSLGIPGERLLLNSMDVPKEADREDISMMTRLEKSLTIDFPRETGCSTLNKKDLLWDTNGALTKRLIPGTVLLFNNLERALKERARASTPEVCS